MNYYPFHIGDFSARTAHLDLIEDIAYRRMLDIYYTTERPLPVAPHEVARLIRMKSNLQEVESVLREFFVLTDDGWQNKRCDEIIAEYTEKLEKAARSANARWSKQDRNANAMRTHSERNADAMLTINQEPKVNPLSEQPSSLQRQRQPREPPPEDAATTGDFLGSTDLPGCDPPEAVPRIPDPPQDKADPPPGLDPAAWDRWLAYRRDIRKPIKPASLLAAQRKLAGFGADQAKVVDESIANGWQGLFALDRVRSPPGRAEDARLAAARTIFGDEIEGGQWHGNIIDITPTAPECGGGGDFPGVAGQLRGPIPEPVADRADDARRSA